jgi:hypothetical protein
MNNSICFPDEDDVTRQKTKLEVLVEPQIGAQSLRYGRTISHAMVCEHGWRIDDILARGGQITGKVRCLECGAVIDDPHYNQK